MLTLGLDNAAWIVQHYYYYLLLLFIIITFNSHFSIESLLNDLLFVVD